MNASRHAILSDIAREKGTPCFVYFMDDVMARVEGIRKSFGERFHVSYAMKSNPNIGILQHMRKSCEFLDISSGGELKKALDAEWKSDRISFTGPGKRCEELQAAIHHHVGEIVVESVREAEAINSLAASAGRCQPVLVRISPERIPRGFGVHMAGKPTQFGIDEEKIDAAFEQILGMSSIDVQGLHIYSGTQCLDAVSIVENYTNFVDIFRRVCEMHDMVPRKLVFGSGIGIPYHRDNNAVSLEDVAPKVNALLDALRGDARFEKAVCVLETGRYLVGEAGIYLTRVLHRKESRGSVICVCDGGMNHHLGACGHLGGVLHRNYPIFKVECSGGEVAAEETIDLVGPMCTSIDTLGQRVSMAPLSVGDVVGVKCSGAYGMTASPILFISHNLPGEYLVQCPGDEIVISESSHTVPSW